MAAVAGVLSASFGALSWLLHLGGGLLFWTLLEYGLHRFAHESSFSIGDGRRPHLGHHPRPTDLAIMVTPLSFTLPVTLALWGCFRLALGAWPEASVALLGVLVGYVTYEVIHYRVHMTDRPGPVLQRLRDYQLEHHFRSATGRHGVTTPLWDFVFRS